MTRSPITVLLGTAAAVLALTACGSAAVIPAGGSGEPSMGTAGPPVVLDCDAPGSTAPAPEPGAFVAAGATAARICAAAPGDPGPYGRPIPPVLRAADEGPTLYHGVDRLVTALNALSTEVGWCTADVPALATLVLAYPDGGRAELAVEQGACGTVRSGDVVRYGWSGSVLTELLELQQLAAAPATPPAAPDCAPTRPPGRIELRDDALVAHPKVPVPYQPAVATICRYRQVPGADFELLRGLAVPADEAARLRTAVNDAVPEDIIEGDAEFCPSAAETVDVLQFLDRAGRGYEVVVRGGDCPRLYTDWAFPFAAPPALVEQVGKLVG